MLSKKTIEEKGSALLEVAISMLFFIPVVFGVIDICIMLTNYQKLEQAVREGVRTASRLPVLTQDQVYIDHDTLANINACQVTIPPEPTLALDCGHVLMQARIRSIMIHERLINFNAVQTVAGVQVADAQITSLFCSPTSTTPECPTGSTNDTVSASVSGQYLGFFGTWPLSATYQSPWLYQNVGAPNN